VADQFPGPTKMVLSSAAQAVRDAFFNGPDDFTASIAAALRAAADQVMPEEPPLTQRQARNIVRVKRYQQRQQIRSELLALATELDTTP
jgi:hypothetical protein